MNISMLQKRVSAVEWRTKKDVRVLAFQQLHLDAAAPKYRLASDYRFAAVDILDLRFCSGVET
jgi:hypothetical protein